MEFHDVVRWLVSAGIERSIVIERFLLSARHGEFGRRGPQERIDRLFDLGGFSIFAPGQYPLRPSYITVEACPESMRARRSVWARWIQAQGWPLPAWLPRSTLIEHQAAAQSLPAPTAEPAPEVLRAADEEPKKPGGRGRPRGAAPQLRAATEFLNHLIVSGKWKVGQPVNGIAKLVPKISISTLGRAAEAIKKSRSNY